MVWKSIILLFVLNVIVKCFTLLQLWEDAWKREQIPHCDVSVHKSSLLFNGTSGDLHMNTQNIFIRSANASTFDCFIPWDKHNHKRSKDWCQGQQVYLSPPWTLEAYFWMTGSCSNSQAVGRSFGFSYEDNNGSVMSANS